MVGYDILLNRKMELLEQIYSNTVDQECFIQKKDEETLNKLLEQRENLMNEVDKIDHLALQSKESTSEENLKLHNDQIYDILKKIQQQDQKNYQQAEKYMQELKKTMHTMDQGRKAITDGYFKSYAQTYGYFIDKKIGK